MIAIRGAITVKENKKQDILTATKRLYERIVEKNNVESEEMVSIIISATKDLDKVYPAVAIRELGVVDVPLLCVQEMFVEGSLAKTIRVLIQVDTDRLDKKSVRHVYLEGAKKLRPDLVD